MSAFPLPKGWGRARLSDLAGSEGVFVDGDWVESKDQDPNGDVRLIQLADVGDGRYVNKSSRFLTSERAAHLRCTFLEPGDVLVARMPDPLGRAYLFPGDPKPCVTVVDVCIIRNATGLVSHRWLMGAINSLEFRSAVAAEQSGSTRKRISRSNLGALELPIPPSREQERIVAATEQHLSDIDAGVAGLKRVLVHLRRYRAAVLKAACEGRLVPTEAALAKKEKRDYEPADVLLKRILQERRARWEADQLAKLAAKGQTPKDDAWRAKYEELAPPHTEGLAVLPDGWRWIALGSAIGAIEAGASFQCDERKPSENEVGVVKVSAVTWGEYDEDETKTCMDPSRVDPGLFVAPGDFLFSRANTIELVGACVIAKHVTRSAMLSDKILRFRLVGLEPLWALYMLRSRLGRNEIERLATGNQDSMRNIGQVRIRQIRIPLPPLAEQHRIVAEVDRLLSTADETEQTVRAQLARASRLRQSVLKRAFEGKLVPQDPNDEPATVLLERIRADKAAAETKPSKPAARGRRT